MMMLLPALAIAQSGSPLAPPTSPLTASEGGGGNPSAPAAFKPPTAADGEAGGEAGRLPTFQELFLFDPYINGTILALSALATILFVYFLLSINSRSFVPGSFVDEVTRLVIRRRFEQAADVCRSHRRVFAAGVIQRVLESEARGVKRDHGSTLEMIETEGRRRADLIWNRISYLADISNVAPMLGLLGTVIGLLYVFFGLETQSGNFASKVLSQGVGRAMSTTMFGLGVGIVSLVYYSIIKSRTTRALAEAEAAVHSIADHLQQPAEGATVEASTADEDSEPAPLPSKSGRRAADRKA